MINGSGINKGLSYIFLVYFCFHMRVDAVTEFRSRMGVGHDWTDGGGGGLVMVGFVDISVLL